jgi:hypothetical protein
MFRYVSLTALALAIASLTGTSARAQYGYGGYGGWGGWGGSSTVGGDMARGMGVFAAGAGMYNEQTAQARSMNTDTAMRLNEYLYQSQMVSTRKYHQELAERRKRVNASADAVYRRLHDNPEPADIRSGDALNVVLDEINNPQVYLRTAKLASKPIQSRMVKTIPFQYAIRAITISLNELSQRGVPDELAENPAFENERKAVKDIFAQAKKESDGAGQVSIETLRKARTAITTLKNKVDATLAAGAPGRAASDNFLKALYGLTKMLETPDVARYLKELDTMSTTTLGELLGFMNSFNLRFGPAGTPAQQTVYTQLYPMLVALRDQVGPESSKSAKQPAELPDPTRGTEFFSGMEYDHLKGKQNPQATPAPPPPGQAPIR